MMVLLSVRRLISPGGCTWHYTDRDVPEAVFTKLKVE